MFRLETDKRQAIASFATISEAHKRADELSLKHYDIVSPVGERYQFNWITVNLKDW